MPEVFLRVVSGLVLACATARADRAVHVEVAPDAPVQPDELAAALRLRIADTGAAVSLRVRRSDDGVIAVVDQRERAIALGGRTGIDAARLIALAVADLVQVDAVVELPPPVVIPARTAIEVSVVGSASAWSAPMAGGAIDLAAARGRWILAAEIGAGKLVDGALQLGGASVRLDGGVRVNDLVDVRAGVVLAPIWIGNGAGDRTVLAGAGASARLRIPIARDLRLVLAAGLDAFATRSEYIVGPMTTLSTPWIAPWGAAGVEVTW